MPTAVREQVLAALLTALKAVAGINAERQFVDDLSDLVPCALLFEREGHQVEQRETGSEAILMPALVVGVAKAATALAASTAANDLHAKIVQAMTTAAAVKAITEDVRETAMRGPQIDRPEEAAEFFAVIEIDFTVEFSRAEDDPFNFG